jgi:hypothetical protein
MKRLLPYIFLLFFSAIAVAQIGIGNTDPQAQLDITAGIVPSEKDGLLIPRLDEFPTGVGTDQDGMIVFITGSGAAARGFIIGIMILLDGLRLERVL